MRLRHLLVVLVPLLVTCTDEVTIRPSSYPYLDGPCDPIVPSHCGLPFPSNTYLAPDGTTATGYRVAFPKNAWPQLPNDTSTAPFATLDGFSPGATLLAHFPGATETGLATPESIADSLAQGSPTVLIEADTGRRVPHFAGLDATAPTEDDRALLIQPAERLHDATRYLVAVRFLVDAQGHRLEPSPAFRALRDKKTSSEVSVDRRRGLYEDIFARLADAGVARGDVQLAWDFTTGSTACHTARMLSMRDAAFAYADANGLPYVIDQVDPAPNAHLAKRIHGHFTAPSFLDSPDPGGSLVLGSDGMPVRNGTLDVAFEILVPISVTTGTPGALVEYGHGLFGTHGEIEQDYLAAFADQYGYVMFALDWVGMTKPDALWLSMQIPSGDMSVFEPVPDRLHQAMVNFLLAMRLMSGSIANDAELTYGGASVIDGTRRFFYGNSQGGILGTTYMALTPDVTRGVLGVPGMPFALLMNRSRLFDPFFTLLRNAYPNGIDVQIAEGLVQMLWDRAEPDGYAPFVTTNPLPGSPTHTVLIQAALADPEVSTYGAHVLARTLGAKLLTPANRSIFGLEEASGDVTTSAIVEFDFHQPAPPLDDLPPRTGEDTHLLPRQQPEGQAQIDHFFRTGIIVNTCDGPCDPG